MDGGCIAETGRGTHIIERQPDGQVAAIVPDREVTAPADTGDGPPVAILDPIGGSESKSAVVAAGDDHISDTGLVPVRQTHLGRGRETVEAMITGATVELGDKLAGGGEHDRVKPRHPIGNPSAESILGSFSNVADMNTAVIKIEVERRRLAFAEHE
jgi:hypothetical protein